MKPRQRRESFPRSLLRPLLRFYIAMPEVGPTSTSIRLPADEPGAGLQRRPEDIALAALGPGKVYNFLAVQNAAVY